MNLRVADAHADAGPPDAVEDTLHLEVEQQGQDAGVTQDDVTAAEVDHFGVPADQPGLDVCSNRFRIAERRRAEAAAARQLEIDLVLEQYRRLAE